ncbi:amino acid dehydrogenase [Pokkaliibacter plantistimulans]|uniref:Amino acid dehydrogenase n=1 Tax=Pokkaliibacter plantistimulans TaxID=1635171 RepID=A0ABX5LY86_9GAMM|nr:D-amino acid dehydrogenase [Pokkaliibacter plantistimulans]PXF29655.1 amino acid dehydrogenase [Pokkaliibacter plantistimulans]
MSSHCLIIGAGVIGLTTAYALLQRGHRVTLVEACREVGMGTSYANGGQLSYRYVAPLADVGVPLQALGWMLNRDAPLTFRPRLDLQQWRWCATFLAACRRSVNQRNGQRLLQLALLSQQQLHAWQAQSPLADFSWRSNGKLVVYRQPQALSRAAASRVAADSQQVLNRQQLLALEPSLAGMAEQLSGAIFTPGDEVGDCHLFCQALLGYLQQQNRFRLVEQCPVSALTQQAGQIQAIETDLGPLQADHYILTAGMGSYELAKALGLHLPLYPLKGYSLTLPLAEEAVAPHISVTDYERKMVYARLPATDALPQRLRVAAMVDIGVQDTLITPRRIQSLRQQATASFPAAGDFTQAHSWAGLRPATPTGLPVIGATRWRNLWLNLGHGALGFTLACGSATLLAEQLSGQPTSISLNGLTLGL